VDEWRNGRAGRRSIRCDEGRAAGGGAKVEVGVVAEEEVVGTAGRNFDDGSDGKIGEEFVPEAGVGHFVGGLVNGAGDPTVTLIEIGIAAVELREAVVLRREKSGKVGRIINGVGVGPAGEKLEAVGEALRHRESEGVIDGIPVGALRVNVAQGHLNAWEARGKAKKPGQAGHAGGSAIAVAAGKKAGEGGVGAGGAEEIEYRCAGDRTAGKELGAAVADGRAGASGVANREAGASRARSDHEDAAAQWSGLTTGA